MLSDQSEEAFAYTIRNRSDHPAGHLSIAASDSDRVRLLRLAPRGLKWLTLLLGAAHTWAAVRSYSMTEDGISYLDIGDAYMRGDWDTAINSVWSPLYSWILGPVMRLLQPSMRWEFATVQFVNFGILVLALLCFESFWRQVVQCHKATSVRFSSDDRLVLPGWLAWSIGYLVFGYSSLNLIYVWSVTPDMLTSALVYLAAREIVKARLESWTWAAGARTGLLLGLGYLSKSVLFPLGFAFLALGVFAGGNWRRAAPRVGLALLCFLMVSVPFITLISIKTGAFTFGDAGKLTYVRYINDVEYPHWQGGPAGNGEPKHPTRLVLDDPPVYEFGSPVGGSYPVSLDPSYWYAGVTARIDISRQVQRVLSSASYYLDLFFRQQAALLFGFLLLRLAAPRERRPLSAQLSRWGLALFALAGMALYSVVLVDGRYIGAFVVLLWADILANVGISPKAISARLLRITGLMMIVLTLASMVLFNLEGVLKLTGSRDSRGIGGHESAASVRPVEVAEELQRMGVGKGESVGVIGDAFTAFWARLARVRIVAEMPGRYADSFWQGSTETRLRVLNAFGEAGVRAIVAENVPQDADKQGWLRIKGSDQFVYFFEPR